MTTSPSEEEAALKVKANQAGAEVAETVRREPSFRAQSLSSDHTASAHRMHALLSTTARIRPARSPPAAYTALYGSPHTHVSVSSLAEAVARS